VEGIETEAVDERLPTASPASPTMKEKRNDAAMGKATPRTPRTADLSRRRLRAAGSAPSPTADHGERAGGSITWTGDPSVGCRRSPDTGDWVGEGGLWKLEGVG
jgi:hypothetical protein